MMELSTRTLGDWLEHWALTTPDKEDIVYDMNMGKFVNAKDATRNQRDQLENSRREAIDNNMESLEQKYLEALKKKKMLKNPITV